ncbi:MAG: peptidase E [Flavobacteriaceae bacterium]|nr:peptidase E [Flavobacteriaceae bacterium]
MKKVILVLLLGILLVSNSAYHKYYVSVSEVEFSKEDEALQIITRLFIDDFQEAIQQRYDHTAKLGDEESKNAEYFIKKYFDKKFLVTINGEKKQLSFFGKEYEDDMIVCYIEVLNVKKINSLAIQNTLLFDLTEEQQNIIHLDVNSKKKSFALRAGNDKGMLNF